MYSSNNDACYSKHPKTLGLTYFYTVTHIIQQGVIYGLPDVAHGSLHVPGGDDLVGARGVFVSGEDPNLSSGNFLFMNVHSLNEKIGICCEQSQPSCIYFLKN